MRAVLVLLSVWLASGDGAPIILEDEEIITTTFPPGPPQILSDEAGDLQGMEMEDYDDMEDFRIRQSSEISVEIEAFVSQSPSEDVSLEEREKNVTSSDSDYETILKTLEVDNDLSLVLTWWQAAIIGLGCLLVTCLCCYITSCCYLSLDCCSDPYWGCCPLCLPCVSPTRPPHHTKADLSPEPARPDESRYSLNENNGAPRTRGSARSININNNKSQSQSLLSNGSKERRPSSSGGRGDSSTNPRAGTQQSLASLSSPSATLSSVKSVRNYKRTRPASQLPGDKQPAGLSESLPHVYQDTTGSYFSWLHLFGKSKKQSYKVSRRKKPSSSNPGRTQQYRQTRYRHIAESRNSAVIPTRIAKRSSTASTYNMRPQIALRSRSAETVDELEDVLSPLTMLETAASERHLPPRSRLSANLAGLQGGPGYNLRYFEKSLMKSKETTL